MNETFQLKGVSLKWICTKCSFIKSLSISLLLTAFGVSFSSFRNHSFLLKQLCFDQTAAFRTSTSPREAKNSFLSFKEIKFNTVPITWYFIVQKCFLRTWLSASCSVYGGYYSRLGWLYVAQILFLHAWIPPGEPSQHVPSLHSFKHRLVWRNGAMLNFKQDPWINTQACIGLIRWPILHKDNK